MKPHRAGLAAVFLGCALVLTTGWSRAETAPLSRNEFAWRAPLQVPAGASVARVSLPPAALLQLQSGYARDVRIFNTAGESVAFARMAPPALPIMRTQRYPALPLFSAAAKTLPPKGAVQVRVDGAAGGPSVWVQMDGAPAAGSRALNSALFATRDEKRLLRALEVQAAVPPNTPVRMAVFTSTDLAQWTPAPMRGRLYRFEGEQAPVNMTLEFDQPLNLEGRYLRLDWTGQDGVTVSAVSGVVAPAAQEPARVRAELSAPIAADKGAVEIETGFFTPMAGLSLSTPRENFLLPVRILGRTDRSQPWRLLGQTVVYRLASGGGDATNPPAPLHGASARWLRIESTNGSDVGAARLQAHAEFDPIQLIFVATGAGPFELAAGRPATAHAALPLATISGALGTRKPEDLPAAEIGAPLPVAKPEPTVIARLWPGGEAPGKTAVLWGVLLAGVLLLAAVAVALLRQLKPPAAPPNP